MRNESIGRQRIGRAALAAVALVLTGGMVAAALSGPPAGAAQSGAEMEAGAESAACRTVLQGDQTNLVLFDLSQFVPVSELGDSAAAATSALATPIPAPAEPEPAASPEATPIADDAGDRSAIENTLRRLTFGVLNCTSQRDFETLGALVTDTYLRFTFAGGANLSRDELLLLAAVTVIPQLELIAFDNVEVSFDRATAEVISLSGNQLRHEQWSYLRRDAASDWVVDRVTALLPLAVAGSATTSVEISENGLRVTPREVSGGNVVLLGENSDTVEHEMLVLRLPRGTTTDILLGHAGPDLPAGVDFIGQMIVPAGGAAVLPLMNLPAGNYVVVDMLLDETGSPNLGEGFRARLIIE